MCSRANIVNIAQLADRKIPDSRTIMTSCKIHSNQAIKKMNRVKVFFKKSMPVAVDHCNSEGIYFMANKLRAQYRY